MRAPSHTTEEIRRIIGADSLEFMPMGDLLKTVEGSGCGFCRGCFDGNYPMPVPDSATAESCVAAK